MVGTYPIRIFTNRVEYNLELRRKFTFIVGDSGTGKTRLANLITRAGTNNRVSLMTKVRIIVPTQKEELYDSLRNKTEAVIYVIDEALCGVLNNKEFARLAETAEGYFVMITRSKFECIPYSVREVYELVSKNTGRKTYYSLSHVYNWKNDMSVDADFILTEDSKSGYYFYKETCTGVVESANGNSNIPSKVEEAISRGYKHVFIVADGAAFGSQIHKYFELCSTYPYDIRLFCPESFEYLILKSGIFSFNMDKIINTQNYADSRKFFSWERYYTWLLNEVASKYGGYRKSGKGSNYKLPKYLTGKKSIDKIYYVIKEIKNVKVVDR